jgi:hypothetical protein
VYLDGLAGANTVDATIKNAALAEESITLPSDTTTANLVPLLAWANFTEGHDGTMKFIKLNASSIKNIGGSLAGKTVTIELSNELSAGVAGSSQFLLFLGNNYYATFYTNAGSGDSPTGLLCVTVTTA